MRGKFYEPEIQAVFKEDDVYKIEKIVTTRKKGKKKEYFVKWKGYGDEFNTWVTEIFKL